MLASYFWNKTLVSELCEILFKIFNESFKSFSSSSSDGNNVSFEINSNKTGMKPDDSFKNRKKN